MSVKVEIKKQSSKQKNDAMELKMIGEIKLNTCKAVD
jgi:hypothetical protein